MTHKIVIVSPMESRRGENMKISSQRMFKENNFPSDTNIKTIMLNSQANVDVI